VDGASSLADGWRNQNTKHDVTPSTSTQEETLLRLLGWIIAIIFLIGLLVVFGVLKLIF
jgi:hypothetical protein